MSLYNALFGENPLADVLLGVLGLTQTDCGRFRDVFLAEGGTEIHVYTRNGGGNRDDYMPDFSGHPQYLGDRDDDFDCTYATIRFKTPSVALPMLSEIAAMNADAPTPTVRWEQLFADLQASGTSPEAERGKRALEPLFKALRAGKGGVFTV